MKPNTCLFDNKIISISFPLVITIEIIDSLLPKNEEPSSCLHMYL